VARSLSMKLLAAVSIITCALYYGGSLEQVLDWMGILGLDIAFRILAIYLFLYWVVIEAKNSYLEWKYRDES